MAERIKIEPKKIRIESTRPAFFKLHVAAWRTNKIGQVDKGTPAKPKKPRYQVTLLLDPSNVKNQETIKEIKDEAARLLDFKYGSRENWPKDNEITGTKGLIMSFGMSFAGSMGVSRRSWDIDAGGSIYGPTAHLFLALVGIGGTVAFIALFLYVGLTVGTLLFGRRIAAGKSMEDWGTPKVLSTSPGHDHVAPAPGFAGGATVAEAHPTQGTMVLAVIFLLSFAVYYFANWKALADVWPVR